jgi:hypothetical protein
MLGMMADGRFSEAGEDEKDGKTEGRDWRIPLKLEKND